MSLDWRQVLDQAIDDRFADIVQVRRRLHSRPEVSGEERETSLYLYQLIGDAGFEVRMGHEGRGLVADMKPATTSAADEADLIALRADIDALRIHDAKQVEYRSRNDGIMHACGHDAHTAVVYGALLALQALQQAQQLPWPVRVRGIFQPAEEISEGAKQMIAVGALDDAKSILAVHVDPSRAMGRIGLRCGILTANCDEMTLSVSGRGGHAARPHETRDPVAAAAQLINSIYLNIPRATDSQDAVVVTFGQISGGENANVIPEKVVLRGTVRTLERNIRRQTIEHVCRLAEGIARMTDTTVKVDFGLSSDSVNNDRRLIELVRMAGREVVGSDKIDEIPRASMGSEDFAYYLEHVPGALIRLGSSSARAGNSPLHTPTFDVDEECIRVGARLLARATVFWSDPSRTSSRSTDFQI